MKRTRAERIKNHKRMVKRTENFQCIQWLKKNYPAQFERTVKRMAENRKQCSCYMCRTPRHNLLLKKKERLTLQERRFDKMQLE